MQNRLNVLMRFLVLRRLIRLVTQIPMERRLEVPCRFFQKQPGNVIVDLTDVLKQKVKIRQALIKAHSVFTLDVGVRSESGSVPFSVLHGSEHDSAEGVERSRDPCRAGTERSTALVGSVCRRLLIQFSGSVMFSVINYQTYSKLADKIVLLD